MAYETGTATSHKDLLEKIKIFLTTNATLVGLGQEWVTQRSIQGHAIRYIANTATGSAPRFAFDSDDSTVWESAAETGGLGILSVQLDAAYAVSYFRLTSYTSGAPSDLDLEYSDDGIIWFVAQSYSDLSWYTYETKLFATNVANTETHVYWRITATGVPSPYHVFIVSMELFEFGDVSYTYDLAREDELIIKGPGLSGTEEIYVGIRTYSDADADWYNFGFNAFTGYVEGSGFNYQPGRKSTNNMIPLWKQSIPYYIRANGQQVTVLAKIETVFMMLYAGKYLPYSTPGQYPLPLALCGAYPSDDALRYDDPALGCQLKTGVDIRFVDGSWKSADVWPYFNHDATNSYSPLPPYPFYTYACRDMEDTYAAVPPIMHDEDGVYGELDGVYFISGFNNAVENTLTIGGDTHVIWRNLEETGFDDYYSMELT